MRSIVLLTAAVLCACGGEPSEPKTPLEQAWALNNTKLSGTWVLSKFDTQTVAPFVTSDAICKNGSHLRSVIVGDTVVLSADANARHATATQSITDGVGDPIAYFNIPGDWRWWVSLGTYYYEGAPAVAVDGVLNARSYLLNLRMESPTTFSNPVGLGGSCGGANVPFRQVIALYTKR